MEADKEWKKSVGFPINYSPANTDDDSDQQDVVMRHPRQSELMLADEGDGAEADLLGTTPPRERIRDKKKRKAYMDATVGLREGKDLIVEQTVPDRPRNRLSLKIQRARERDYKQSMDLGKADSFPSPNPNQVGVPTLVESCSRFMSLSSRLKCRENCQDEEPEVERRADEEFPPSRVNFHKTFSMLINMGNIDKGCRRTISREEQVWQNELKDLIWLELQAKIAGRTLPEQDAFLCAQRNIVPAIVHNIRNYRFVNPNPCRSRSRRLGVIEGSTEDLRDKPDVESDTLDEESYCCLSFNCQQCTEAVGKALREVGTLLDSYHNALSLYPSSHAMTTDHPLVATQLFKNRLKAMCLWYNTAMHMRLKVIAVRRMIRTIKLKMKRRGYTHLASTDSDGSRYSTDSPRPCQVRFNVSNTPSSSNTSNNSESSAATEINKEENQKESVGESNEEESQKKSVRESIEEESQKEAAEESNEESQKSVGESNKESQKSVGESNEESQKSVGESNEEESKKEREEDVGRVGRIVSQFEGKEKENEGKTDEVDSSCDKKLVPSTPTTPEIVISDIRYGTSDTSTSNESGYMSCAEEQGRQDDDVYDIGSIEELTELRLLNKVKVSIYRSYHYEVLKTQGVRRCMMFMNKMRHNVLHNVCLTLHKPDEVKPEPYSTVEEDPVEVFDDTKEEEDGSQPKDEDAIKTYELRRYGCWSEESLAMRLPSYRNHFLLLSTICMEAVHDYLSLRLEDRPQNPSCLTVKQLIHELKEGLDIATEMRAAFARNIEMALAGQSASAQARRDLLLIFKIFDESIETVLKQYLSYLVTMSEVEHMNRACLQLEWSFTARLAKRVKCAALLAPQTFSEIACNQLRRLGRQFNQKFEKIQELEMTGSVGDPDKHFVYSICRAVQHIYASERDAIIQNTQWARCVASRLARAPPPAYTAQRQDIFNSLMEIRDLIVMQTKKVLEKSRSEVQTHTEMPKDSIEAVGSRVRELMLQIYRLGFELHRELYRFVNEPFQLIQERISRRRPVSLQPIRQRDFRERRKRPETMLIHESFNPMIHKELHRFVNDSSLQFNRRSANITPPKGGRPKFNRSESIGEDAETNVFEFETINNYSENMTQSSIELLLAGEKVQPEGVELRSNNVVESKTSREERQWATVVARAVVDFAQCWMQFVIERCEKGRGLRPRWAHQGLEFLMLACDPCNTKHLTEKEFEDLKKQMDGCISHVIGSRPVTPRVLDNGCSTPEHGSRRRPRLHSPLPGNNSRAVPAPPTPPLGPDPLFNFPEVDCAAHSARVLEATRQLDEAREQKLREAKALGHVLESTVSTYEPKLRQLKFKWQRGLKIGAGTFGKVYTVVNSETGQLLAMKEISIGVGDRRALQRAANELRVLEGVIHPHLVRYYGCELHREEMLLFMELCVEGSLEALIATSGALEEHMIRRYTKQMVSAVMELHARSIAHRDIKSGNIFLTNEGNCLKLGDFGCAVKIRANTTAAGELMGHVGTQAYMAPEVFMKSTGHGRAADIWSLGCVVTEMASGKRPFSEYDSNVQIMFVVGMGGRPAIPETLSEEGQEFCTACLTHEPDQRPKAETLSLHHFLMLNTDDDCNCAPAFLMT